MSGTYSHPLLPSEMSPDMRRSINLYRGTYDETDTRIVPGTLQTTWDVNALRSPAISSARGIKSLRTRIKSSRSRRFSLRVVEISRRY